jgi:hypothetical protein
LPIDTKSRHLTVTAGMFWNVSVRCPTKMATSWCVPPDHHRAGVRMMQVIGERQ